MSKYGLIVNVMHGGHIIPSRTTDQEQMAHQMALRNGFLMKGDVVVIKTHIIDVEEPKIYRDSVSIPIEDIPELIEKLNEIIK